MKAYLDKIIELVRGDGPVVWGEVMVCLKRLRAAPPMHAEALRYITPRIEAPPRPSGIIAQLSHTSVKSELRDHAEEE